MNSRNFAFLSDDDDGCYDQHLKPTGVARCRGTDGEKAVLQAIDTALARASQVEPAFAPEKKKKNKGNVLDESYELQRSAFMAARAALKGNVSSFASCLLQL